MPAATTILPQLESVFQGLREIYPETGLAVLFIILILADILLGKKAFRVLPYLTLLGLAIVLLLVLRQHGESEASPNKFIFGKFLHLNLYEVFFKILFLLAGMASIWMTMISTSLRNYREKLGGEYYSMLVALILGLHLLVMASNLLMIYLSLEFVSISSYILTSFAFSKKSSEAGIKYLLFGAFSSGLMLYGMSFLYGFTGSLQFYEPDFLEALQNVDPWFLTGVALLVLAGFLFKISAFPFHLWTPDVYEGAPVPVTAFFSVAPKAAGVAVLINFTYPFFYNRFLDIELIPWKLILGVLAIATFTLGNLAALGQNNAKRLLAYSSIAHAGFILTGLLAFSAFGVQSVLFYLSIYFPMNFAAFALVEIMSEKTGSEDVRNFKGLGGKLPLAGVIFVVVMIALTGLPPTAGFHAKLLAFSALWQAYQESGESILLWVFIGGLLNSVVALFYYLKIPYFMFFRKAEGKEIEGKLGTGSSVFLLLLSLPLLVLFFKPDWLMNYIQKIILNF